MSQAFRLPTIAIELAESAERPPERIQVMRVGTFHHPVYGKFEITKDVLLSLKKNFDAKVRGVDIAIDYSHNSEGEAAAWFKDLELSNDGTELWGRPDWTPGGAESVLSKRFRYISADIAANYQDNESLKKFGPTLMGAGLTNRPVIKGQAPIIELSEGKGDEMDPKDKEIADLKAQLADLQKQLAEAKGAPAQGAELELSTAKKQIEDQNKQLSELRAQVKKQEEEKQLSEKKSQFDLKLSEGKVCEAQREPFMKGDMTKFMELAQPVKLSNKGSGDEGGETETGDKTPAQEVLELAEKMVSEKRAPNKTAAISLVLSENAELKKRYYANH